MHPPTEGEILGNMWDKTNWATPTHEATLNPSEGGRLLIVFSALIHAVDANHKYLMGPPGLEPGTFGL